MLLSLCSWENLLGYCWLLEYAALRAGSKLAHITSIKACPLSLVGIPKEIGTPSGESRYLLQDIPQGTERLVPYQISSFIMKEDLGIKEYFFFLQKRNLSQWNELEDDKNRALLFISYKIISHCFSISDSFHYSFQVRIASPCKKLKLKSLLIELPKKASDITFSCLLCLVEKKRTAVQKPHPFSGATSS